MYTPDTPAFLSILNPVSFVELSVHVRFIWLVDTGVAERAEGAVRKVEALASLE